MIVLCHRKVKTGSLLTYMETVYHCIKIFALTIQLLLW